MTFNLQCLKQVLRYSLETGEWNHTRDGARADTNGGRYRSVKVCGIAFQSHNLAHFYMTGLWPVELIDHRDRNGHNNKWANLRPATYTQNQGNRRRQTKLKGVYFDARRNTWRTGITNWEGKRVKSLGTFNCPAAAHFAYLVAADKKFGSFAYAGR